MLISKKKIEKKINYKWGDQTVQKKKETRKEKQLKK
jgi:hypothetical protein